MYIIQDLQNSPEKPADVHPYPWISDPSNLGRIFQPHSTTSGIAAECRRGFDLKTGRKPTVFYEKRTHAKTMQKHHMFKV
jgi:hypothetical protein